jgi:hypothetical protein
MSEWLQLQQGAYPAYITWEQYLANQERLRENSTLFEWKKQNRRGPAREGNALLQGLAVCGRCGIRMRVGYKETPRYSCRDLSHKVMERICWSLHGPSIDAAMVAAFFEALKPAQLDALAAVLEQQAAEQFRLQRHWQEQVRRAEYEVQLARRQYNAVDPDNRLVAGELERQWEAKLQALHEVQEEYGRFQQRAPLPTLTEQQRRQFGEFSESLPALWEKLAVIEQKELLRCLIERVILQRRSADQVEARIVWVSGHYTQLLIRPPIHREADVTGYDEMIKRIEELWRNGLDNDEAIAAQLSEEGFHSARSERVAARSVQKIRLRHGWHTTYHQSRKASSVGGWLTARGLAERLGVERTWVYKRIYAGIIEAADVQRHRHSSVWLIRDDPALIAKLEALVHRNLNP